MTDNIFRETADEIDGARKALIATAYKLCQCLSEINRHGDMLSARLVCQGDGYAYGEVYDGFKILMGVLFPDDGVEGRHLQMIDAMFDSDFTVEEAFEYVADKNSPRFGYPTDDVREELVRYRAYLVALNEGVLKADRLIGVDDPDEARKWLTGEINECLAALAYRNEPEDRTLNVAGSLIADWLRERCSSISDRSSDTYNDWQAAIDQAKAKAEAANIPWDDAFVPSYIRERLEDDDG